MTLQHLDTLIAFAVIMLGLSLLITVFTQIISAALALRGANLLWGLNRLFEAFDPRLKTQAGAILRDPLISDSIFSKIMPDEGGRIAKLCKKIVTLVAPSWVLKRWTLASVIRPEELVRALSKISADLKTQDPNTANAIRVVLDELDPETARKVDMLSEVFRTRSPSYAPQMDKTIQQFWKYARQSVGSLEAQFNTVMDRVSQRFALQMRLWTFVFAVLVAFGAHLDSLILVEQLWSGPEKRASLTINTLDCAKLRRSRSLLESPASWNLGNTLIGQDIKPTEIPPTRLPPWLCGRRIPCRRGFAAA